MSLTDPKGTTMEDQCPSTHDGKRCMLAVHPGTQHKDSNGNMWREEPTVTPDEPQEETDRANGS